MDYGRYPKPLAGPHKRLAHRDHVGSLDIVAAATPNRLKRFFEVPSAPARAVPTHRIQVLRSIRVISRKFLTLFSRRDQPRWHCLLPLIAATCAPILSADLVEQGPGDSPPSGLLAGVARADIAPPVGIAQMNWGSQTHVRALGVDPAGMKATALVLSDGSSKFAMVDVDRILVAGLEPAIEAASERTGIPREHIRIGVSHTHAGVYVSPAKGPPGLDLTPLADMAERYRLSLIDTIAGIIELADRRLEPAHIHGASGHGTININRRVRADGDRPPAVGRNPDGVVDRELVVFRIDDAKGQTMAVIANFQCHGTVLAYENQMISPDWVGMMRVTVERAFPGALSLFFQGAAGDQGPIEGFSGDLSVAHRLGRTLGHQVAAIAMQIETVRRVPKFEGFVESTAYQAKQHWRVLGPRDATLRFASDTIDVPRRTYSPEEVASMRRRLERARRQFDGLPSDAGPLERHQAGARVRRFADLLQQWSRSVEPTPLQIEVQALRVGELALVAMPGEPFSEIGTAVKSASPFRFTMFCGYSDGVGGDYVPTADEYPHGGYEVERTPYGPSAAQLVIEVASALLERIR